MAGMHTHAPTRARPRPPHLALHIVVVRLLRVRREHGLQRDRAVGRHRAVAGRDLHRGVAAGQRHLLGRGVIRGLVQVELHGTGSNAGCARLRACMYECFVHKQGRGGSGRAGHKCARPPASRAQRVRARPCTPTPRSCHSPCSAAPPPRAPPSPLPLPPRTVNGMASAFSSRTSACPRAPPTRHLPKLTAGRSKYTRGSVTRPTSRNST